MLYEEWQALLDSNRELLAGLPAGVRIGLVAAPCKRGASFYVWEVDAEAASARVERFPGLETPGVDLLLVAAQQAIAALSGGRPLGETLRSLIRAGDLQLYLTGGPLTQDPGFRDFLEEFALVFPRH